MEGRQLHYASHLLTSAEQQVQPLFSPPNLRHASRTAGAPPVVAMIVSFFEKQSSPDRGERRMTVETAAYLV